ncbi:MAG: type II toxin-antitoxin system VapC family toxin [Tetrasphaera sp.]
MILDSSAVIAILRSEPEAPELARLIREADSVAIGAPTVLEIAMVAGPSRAADVDDLLARARVDVVAFTADHLAVARRAHAAYGRGSGSPARLNFGDCLSYAVAKLAEDSLLFKGTDFSHTDVVAAR